MGQSFRGTVTWSVRQRTDTDVRGTVAWSVRQRTDTDVLDREKILLLAVSWVAPEHWPAFSVYVWPLARWAATVVAHCDIIIIVIIFCFWQMNRWPKS